MENPGIAPPDPNTDIGQLRYLIPDSSYTELVPPVSGQGDYEWFSDAALGVFLAQSDNDVDAAAIIAWRQMGDYYAAQSASIQTDDLKVSELWRRAQFFYDKANRAEESAAADVFALAPLGSTKKCHHAELAGFWGCGCA